MIKNSSYPMLGAAYYPEAWDESEQDKDIAMMLDAGIKVVRIAEFAWHMMEPHCGEFHFEWLHQVIDKLNNAGIAVILGTPTAVPPIWLEELDWNMMALDENGRRKQHGGRRNICSNNPTYLKYALRITEKMAQEFGNDSRVIGWQIDNEINILDNGCYCNHCLKGWADYLEKKYGTIENLNKRWGLELFSQAYESFEQVSAPKPFSWHGAHIKLDWWLYQAQPHIDFIKMQSEILHRYTKTPIGTDMMPIMQMDYEKMAECTDVMQFNHYNDESNLWEAAFWFDYIRPFKDIPFWNTETSTCWSAGMQTPSNFRAEKFCKANSWLPFVLGGSANLYWLWRQHRTGHELMHGSVLYANGRPMHIFNEVKETAAELEKAADFLMDTKVKTETAMLITSKNSVMINSIQQVTEKTEEETPWRIREIQFYRHLMNAGLRPDVIAAGKELDPYKLIFTPYTLTLEERDLKEKIEKWVKNGGVWVVGPMTDIRDSIGAHYTEASTGILERLTDSCLVQQIPDHRHRIKCEWVDGSEYEACNFLQLFDVPDDAEIFATVKSGFSTLIGKSVLFKKKVGKGSIIVIGALPGNDDMQKLLDLAIQESQVARFVFTGDIVASVRDGEKYSGIAAQEIGGMPGELKIDTPMIDILTGQKYSDRVELSPYQTVILKK